MVTVGSLSLVGSCEAHAFGGLSVCFTARALMLAWSSKLCTVPMEMERPRTARTCDAQGRLVDETPRTHTRDARCAQCGRPG